MTPAEEFAQKRLEAVELIEKHAPARLQSQLIDLLRPAIALKATRCEDEEIPTRKSKFGGAPDVSQDFEWPMWNEKPLGFLAQINLEEIADFDVENLLPKTGLLSFFFFPWDFGYAENDASMRDSWQVFHFESENWVRLAVREELSSENAQSVFPCVLTLKAEWTTKPPADFQFTIEELDQLHEVFYAAFELPRPRHRLLGWPDEVQGPVAEQCAEFSGDIDLSDPNWDEAQANCKIEEWRLLFQMDADWKETGCEWGDDGTNFYMIRQTNLKSENFDDVWFLSECG